MVPGGGSGRLSLSACKAEEKKAITIGASNFTEVNILGNIYRELIEADTDIEVKTSFGLKARPFVLPPWKKATLTCLSNIPEQHSQICWDSRWTQTRSAYMRRFPHR